MNTLRALEEHLQHLPHEQVEVVIEIHNIVASLCPDAVERMDHNGITWYDAKRGGPVKAGICQVFHGDGNLRLAFIHGVFLPDPAHLLQGDTYPKRYYMLGRYDEIPWDVVTTWITAHAAFDPMTLPQNQKD